jgi:hypothetical protein
MPTMTEYGLFNDEGCLEAQMYSTEEAETRRQEYIAEGEHPDDVKVREMCPDHEGEPKDGCEECFAETGDEDDEVGGGDMIGNRMYVRQSASNFGFFSESHTREINGRTYEFMRRVWPKSGRVELWAKPVGTKRGSLHRIMGFVQ